MPRKRDKASGTGLNEAELALQQGEGIVANHPLFAPMKQRTILVQGKRSACPADGWAIVSPRGEIHVSSRRAEPAEWAHVLAHCLLHLGFEHFRETEDPQTWNAACDCVVEQFLAGLRLGRPPAEIRLLEAPPSRDVDQLYRLFRQEGVPRGFAALGTGGSVLDLWMVPMVSAGWRDVDWPKALQSGIVEAVGQAVRVAGGVISTLGSDDRKQSASQLARSWFISSYPLLGALAESFKIIEDLDTCRALDISVAAVDASRREVYINPAVGMSESEARFVMAHELLHVGLCHQQRRCGREPFLWNVACDYVINGWLAEMGIGVMPAFGALHDPELAGLSAEAIYDRIASDLRRIRKLTTLRGTGACDMIEPAQPEWWAHGAGVGLDEFYRSCLARGLEFHDQAGRGLLPAGLIEEIRAIQQPPIPWDVELSQWFDAHFAPLERRRSFARPSRRQSATPDIPRAAWHTPEESLLPRTFGVVVDTSGSMSPQHLGKALGSIASFAVSRDVPRARVVFCDAVPYDAGYLAPGDIAGRVRIRGRGGTVLQPAIRMLEQAQDFPKDSPVLIITDGACDKFEIRREHAFLLPQGRRLPFPPRGPVFYMK